MQEIQWAAGLQLAFTLMSKDCSSDPTLFLPVARSVGQKKVSGRKTNQHWTWVVLIVMLAGQVLAHAQVPMSQLNNDKYRAVTGLAHLCVSVVEIGAGILSMF